MPIKVACKVTVLTKSSFVARETGNTYYKIGVKQENEIGTIFCNKDVYDSVQVDKEYVLCFNANTQNGKMYLESAKNSK